MEVLYSSPYLLSHLWVFLDFWCFFKTPLSLNAETKQLVSIRETSTSTCHYSLAVKAGSVLGVKGGDEVDEAALLSVSGCQRWW